VSDLLNKAKFKARRGLNELDKIFVPFVEKRFLSLGNAQVNQLFDLFEIDDVSLADIIIYKKMDHPIELKEIFEEIFKFYSEI
jgi:succinate dehydrogenase flavin-adding protein (antitoxin of CptAB toxin-antitoxin module)